VEICTGQTPLTSSQFTEKNFKVPHTLKDATKVELEYSVWVKDVMPWIEELVVDPALNEHWEWHAHRQYLHTEGSDPERFITTPMSADFAWETEVSQ
jgi:Plavaka transposase